MPNISQYNTGYNDILINERLQDPRFIYDAKYTDTKQVLQIFGIL